MTVPTFARPVDGATRAKLDRLWDEFKDGGSYDARGELILHYLPLVKNVGATVAASLPGGIEQARLNSYGIYGLYDALDTFELATEITFEAYAIPRIQNGILNELRTLDLVPPSTSFEATDAVKAMRAVKAWAELGRRKRAPTEAELAAALASLTEREKIVVTLFYFDGLTLAEIGEVLGVTESRVAQLHGKAIAQLRDKLRDADS
jgi:RNA polymerase sigma factor for flagellar operon FliA